MAKIRLQTTENMAEIFGDFLISRKTKGVADKTLESYSYHFHAISKHLDTTKEMAMLQKADLEEMIASMRDSYQCKTYPQTDSLSGRSGLRAISV